MIQRTSDVMNCVSREQTNFGGNGIDSDGKENIKVLISWTRMLLGTEGVEIAIEEPIPNDFQILEMCIGPFDFSANEG